MNDLDLDDRRPKNTLGGLREALDHVPQVPPKLSWREYTSLSAELQQAHDDVRLDFTALGLRVNTPEKELAFRKLRATIEMNRRLTNGRRGLLLTAEPFFGKTELALSLARTVENTYGRKHPDYRASGDVPVVWVEVGSNATGKSLLWSLAYFFSPAAPPPESWTTNRLLVLVTGLLRQHRTQLVVIDEAHCLASLRSKGSAGDPSDFIKLLQNQSSATFVLCGVDLLSAQVFGTARGAQVTKRCERIQLGKVNLGNAEGRRNWGTMLAAFDKHLPLCDHKPGMLLANAEVLHRATEGCIGSLALVVTQLVGDMLADSERGDERVTRERLWRVVSEVARTSDTEHTFQQKDIKAQEELLSGAK